MNNRLIACYEGLKATIKSIMPYSNDENGEFHLGLCHSLQDKDESFAVIAVRCDDPLCAGRKNLIAGQMYQLLDGYTISEDTITVSKWRDTQNLLYDDYNADHTNGIPHVQFSAIVGKNGSGKSSIVELIMRLINNFATVIYGELNRDPAAEPLRFVENVMGTLWYAMNGYIYRLFVSRSKVVLTQYKKISTKTNSDTLYGAGVDVINIGDDAPTPSGAMCGINDNEIEKSYLSNFFYTLVSNYSIYAYNTSDYPLEVRSNLGENGENCWLHSLFHKNDGYKVPLGISPFRSEGNMDVNNEKDLAMERLISLMIRNERYRVVNKHLIAEGLNIVNLPIESYGFAEVKSRLHFKELTEDGYKRLSSFILQYWKEFTGIDFIANSKRPFYSTALNYIVYKTLKVSKQYGEHNEFYQLNEIANDFKDDLVKELVKGECENHSHMTRKIFQTIGYLVHDVYDLSNKDADGITSFNSFSDIFKRWFDIKKKFKDYDRTKIHVTDCALIPPPFCTSLIKMHPEDSNETVMFESLSSGERQQLFTISSILYHLDNLNSIKDDQNDKNRIFYPSINIILEEIELYFHPEMQQHFINDLIDGIYAINLEHLKSLNFILVTHSPYVLSDIPRTNILALKDKGHPASKDELKTFGANVHDMLRTSFFLSHGAIGAFAQWEVRHIMACLQIHRWARNGYKDYAEFIEKNNDSDAFEFMERYTSIGKKNEKNQRFFEYERFNADFGAEHIKSKIDLIDEPVLRKALLSEFASTFGIGYVSKEEKRQELLRQLKELEEDDSI